MKTYEKMVTIREGEWFPVDESFDYMGSDVYPCNPEIRQEKWGNFLRCCREPDQYLLSIDYWFKPRRILRIGMYDGWPYWSPYPSVLIEGPFGAERHSWYQIATMREATDG